MAKPPPEDPNTLATAVLNQIRSTEASFHNPAIPGPGEAIIRGDPSPPAVTSPELVDETLKGLNWGNIVFNAPETMKYAQPQLVELLLSPSISVEAMQAQLTQKAGAASAKIQIANRMEALLKKDRDQAFSISSLSPDLQAVASQQVTRWQWEVVPTQPGRQELHLVLLAHIDVAGSDTPYVIKTFDRTIVVNVTAGQRSVEFIQNNWQWLWAAIVVPVAGYLWTRRKKRRHRAAK